MKFYKAIFSAFYKVAILLGNEGVYPEALAYFGAASVIWFNFLTLNIIVEISSGQPFFVEWLMIPLYVLNLVINYFYFIRDDKYLVYLKEIRQHNALNLLSFFYIIASLVLFYYFQNRKRDMI